MQCPVDNETLQIAERQGVEIDYCPRCRGVWLDRGELDKIIDRAADLDDDDDRRPPRRDDDRGYGRQEPRQEPRYDDRRRYDDDDDRYKYAHGQHPKRKKSFLSEMFDF